MEKIYEIGMLLDFYGELLTKRQLEILQMYYNLDYSLGEIADNMDISRQGVYDTLKKGKSLLLKYEEKLGLGQRFLEQENRIKGVIERLDSIEVQSEQIVLAKNELIKIIDEL